MFLTRKKSINCILFSILFIMLLLLTSCKKTTYTKALDLSAQAYLVNDYTISNEEVWYNLKKYCPNIIEDRRIAFALNEEINEINSILDNNSVNNDLYKYIYTKDYIKNRLITYLLKDIYSFNFSKSFYYDDLKKLKENEKKDKCISYLYKLLDTKYYLLKKFKLLDNNIDSYIDYYKLLSSINVCDILNDNSAYINKYYNYDNKNNIIEKFSKLYITEVAKEILCFKSIVKDNNINKFVNIKDKKDKIIIFQKDIVEEFKDLNKKNYDYRLKIFDFDKAFNFQDCLSHLNIKEDNSGFVYKFDNKECYLSCNYNNDNKHFFYRLMNLVYALENGLLDDEIIKKIIPNNDILTDKLDFIVKKDNLKKLIFKLKENIDEKDNFDIKYQTYSYLQLDTIGILDDVKKLKNSKDDDKTKIDLLSCFTKNEISKDDKKYLIYRVNDIVCDNLIASYSEDNRFLFQDLYRKREDDKVFDKVYYHTILKKLYNNIADKKENSHLNKVFDEKLKKLKVWIYDKIIEKEYFKINNKHSKTIKKEKDKNILVKFMMNKDTKYLYINDESTEYDKRGLFQITNDMYGYYESLDIALRKKVMDTDTYKTLKDNNYEISLLKKQLKREITDNTNQNQSKYNYLVTKYGTSDIYKIIYNHLLPKKIINDNLEKQLRSTSHVVNNVNEYNENMFDLTAKKLLIKLNNNNKEKNDNINYNEEQLEQLLKILEKRIKKHDSSSYYNVVEKFVSDYNNSKKYVSTEEKEDNKDITDEEAMFAIARLLKIEITFEEINYKLESNGYDNSEKQLFMSVYKNLLSKKFDQYKEINFYHLSELSDITDSYKTQNTVITNSNGENVMKFLYTKDNNYHAYFFTKCETKLKFDSKVKLELKDNFIYTSDYLYKEKNKAIKKINNTEKNNLDQDYYNIIKGTAHLGGYKFSDDHKKATEKLLDVVDKKINSSFFRLNYYNKLLKGDNTKADYKILNKLFMHMDDSKDKKEYNTLLDDSMLIGNKVIENLAQGGM